MRFNQDDLSDSPIPAEIRRLHMAVFVRALRDLLENSEEQHRRDAIIWFKQLYILDIQISFQNCIDVIPLAHSMVITVAEWVIDAERKKETNTFKWDDGTPTTGQRLVVRKHRKF